ncbi:hypothetical protein EX30DRAFT_365757 [Ascodesmis nigricans]|uniref:Uncharacterized protein n=1 Tax=Ascodesmis nigricans TaxID=341454 RepID=A0A4S2MNM0_9PEZI|nr:hypothetical protein EX30DRAFT_365757 [Ascodesmis nigricans]
MPGFAHPHFPHLLFLNFSLTPPITSKFNPFSSSRSKPNPAIFVQPATPGVPSTPRRPITPPRIITLPPRPPIPTLTPGTLPQPPSPQTPHAFLPSYPRRPQTPPLPRRGTLNNIKEKVKAGLSKIKEGFGRIIKGKKKGHEDDEEIKWFEDAIAMGGDPRGKKGLGLQHAASMVELRGKERMQLD